MGPEERSCRRWPVFRKWGRVGQRRCRFRDRVAEVAAWFRGSGCPADCAGGWARSPGSSRSLLQGAASAAAGRRTD